VGLFFSLSDSPAISILRLPQFEPSTTISFGEWVRAALISGVPV
jgi:hypothetical protein